MIENVHLGDLVNAMHWTSLQQFLIPLPSIVEVSSRCLKAIISLFLSYVRVGGKNLSIKASPNSFQLLTYPHDKDLNQLATISLNENRNSCSLITSRLSPFSFIVFDILQNLPRCSLGSSLGCPVYWCCCTMGIKAGFNSKLLASMCGYLTVEYSFLMLGL